MLDYKFHTQWLEGFYGLLGLELPLPYCSRDIAFCTNAIDIMDLSLIHI